MITDLWIENFKGIGKRQHIPLRPITLLFGANSAGKSTVLHALLYLREILVQNNLDPTGHVGGSETFAFGGFDNLVHNTGPKSEGERARSKSRSPTRDDGRSSAAASAAPARRNRPLLLPQSSEMAAADVAGDPHQGAGLAGQPVPTTPTPLAPVLGLDRSPLPITGLHTALSTFGGTVGGTAIVPPQLPASPAGAQAPSTVTAPPGLTVSEAEREIRELKKLVDQQLGLAINSNVSKAIKNNTLKLAAKVESLQLTQARLEKDKKEFELLENDRIPQGMKPFSVGFESPILDDTILERPEQFSVTIPQGKTLREALRMLHVSHLKHLKAIDIIVDDKQKQRLKDFTKKSAFIQRGCDALPQVPSWSILGIDEDDVDMSNEGILTEENLSKHLSAIYKTVMDKAVVKKVKKLEEAEKN